MAGFEGNDFRIWDYDYERPDAAFSPSSSPMVAAGWRARSGARAGGVGGGDGGDLSRPFLVSLRSARAGSDCVSVRPVSSLLPRTRTSSPASVRFAGLS